MKSTCLASKRPDKSASAFAQEISETFRGWHLGFSIKPCGFSCVCFVRLSIALRFFETDFHSGENSEGVTSVHLWLGRLGLLRACLEGCVVSKLTSPLK